MSVYYVSMLHQKLRQTVFFCYHVNTFCSVADIQLNGHSKMLPSWYEIPAAGPEMQKEYLHLSNVVSPQVVQDPPLHLMTSIETFLDDTSEMELDGSFLTYSDMDLSKDRLDKYHQVAANTTFISPPDLHVHRRIYPKFESTRFLPFEPMFSVTVPYNEVSVDIDKSTFASPLSISSWELDTQSEDIVAPPNSPNLVANESMHAEFVIKAMQNYAVDSRVTGKVLKGKEPSCLSCGSFKRCGCVPSVRSTEQDHINRMSEDIDTLGERLPCDGMESFRETLQVQPPAVVTELPGRHMHSDKNITSDAVTKQKKHYIKFVKTQQGVDKCTREEPSRPKRSHQLVSRAVVKCSMLSLPSNMDSEDDMQCEVPLRPRRCMTNAQCNKPIRTGHACIVPVRMGPAKKSKQILKSAESSRRCHLANMSKKRLPCLLTEQCNNAKQTDMHDKTLPESDMSATTPQDTLSCSVNSDATCFMMRPMCRGAVTTRGQHMSQARQTILSRKLKQIGRYLHSSGGVGRTRFVPGLQTLGVV